MRTVDTFPPGVADIVGSLKNLRIIIFMALSDLRARYKRSVLGPFWVTLSTAAGSAGLGFLWSRLMHMDAHTFVPSLTAGLILWQYMSQLIVESTTIFSRQASIIRNLNLPVSIHPLQLLLRHLINFAHNAPVFIVVAFILKLPFSWTMLWALPGLLILTLNLVWIALLFSMLGARFRDLEYLIASIMPLMMFISPVFYRPNYLKVSAKIIWMNPFSHFIEIVRYPLLGEIPPLFVIEVNVALLVFGSIFTLWLFNKKRTRIPFWI